MVLIQRKLLKHPKKVKNYRFNISCLTDISSWYCSARRLMGVCSFLWSFSSLITCFWLPHTCARDTETVICSEYEGLQFKCFSFISQSCILSLNQQLTAGSETARHSGYVLHDEFLKSQGDPLWRVCWVPAFFFIWACKNYFHFE